MDVTLPFVCPHCRAKSWNINDAERRYCGRCHRFVDEMTMTPDLEHALAELEKARGELEGEIEWQKAKDEP